MRTWCRHRAHTNNRASSIAPPGEEGWTTRVHRAILASEPYASADLGAASDADRQVFTVRGCAGLFAKRDLTPTAQHRHRLRTPRRCPLLGNIDSGGKRPEPSALRTGPPAPSPGNDAHRERPNPSFPASPPGGPQPPPGVTSTLVFGKDLLRADGDATDSSTHTDQGPFAKYARFYEAVNSRWACRVVILENPHFNCGFSRKSSTSRDLNNAEPPSPPGQHASLRCR